MPQLAKLDATAPPAEVEFRASASRDRDETQRHIDGVFGGLADRWVKGGRKPPQNAPRHSFTVLADDVSALKSMIRRAAALHKLAVVFAKDRKDADGTVTVTFVPAPKPEPKAKADGQQSGAASA